MKQSLPQPSEHQIQTAIIGYLRTKKWYVMRLNSGSYSVGEGRYKRHILGQEKGTPDLMAFKPLLIEKDKIHDIAKLVFIEVKRPGKVPTIHQVNKMTELEAYGAQCLVAHSVSEVEEAGL